MTGMSTITSEWITISEAAEIIGCNRRTVQRLAGAGKLRKVEVNPRLYLVHVKDVDTEAKNVSTIGRPRGS